MHTQNRQNESGNMLWLILIAIILLGSLSVMISRSSNTSNETGDYERQTIHATKIMRYAKSIQTGVQNLLARGCSENEISFDNAVVAGYSNPNSPPDESCNLFSVAGAGLTYKAPDPDWFDGVNAAETPYGEWYFPGKTCVQLVGDQAANCALTGNFDALIILSYITKELCISLNRLLDISNPGGDPPQESQHMYVESKFTGSWAHGAGSRGINGLPGTYSACLEGASGFEPDEDTYHFYHVLYAR